MLTTATISTLNATITTKGILKRTTVINKFLSFYFVQEMFSIHLHAIYFTGLFYSKPSIRNVGKILEVHRGLIDLKRQSSNSQCQPSANNTSREEDNTMNDKLVLLSAAETCIVLHRLGSAARIPELVSAAEAQLTRLGVNVRSVLCHGIRSGDGIERSAKLHEGDMKDTEEAVDVDNDSKQLSQTEQSGEEEGKTSSNLQSVAERRETVSGAANDITELENKELARSLLIGAREIFTLTQNVEFM